MLRQIINESINEAHGLSDSDVEYLQNYIKDSEDKRLKTILRFLVKHNVAVTGDKSVNVSKNPKKIKKSKKS
jgi:hypothetical protein